MIRLILLISLNVLLINGRPDIRKVYTPPSFGSTTPSSTTTVKSYAVAAGGKGTVGTTPTPPPRANKPTLAAITGPTNLTFVLAARDLPLKKKGDKIDPYIKVSQRTGTLQEIKDWLPVGQTETLKGTNNPDFTSVFTFEWTRGKNQQWQFEVKGKRTLGKDDDLGKVIIKIDDYVGVNKEDASVKLGEPGAGGTLLVKKVTPVKFQLSGRMIPKLDAFNGASDPFVEVYWRKGKDGNDTKIFTTKVIEDSENPDWKEIIEFQSYQPRSNLWLHFKVLDSDNVSGNDFVGETVLELDPFVTKRQTVNAKLTNKDAKTKEASPILIITPQ